MQYQQINFINIILQKRILFHIKIISLRVIALIWHKFIKNNSYPKIYNQRSIKWRERNRFHKKKKKSHDRHQNRVLSKIRYIKENFIHVSGNTMTTTLSPHYLQDYLSSRRQGAGFRNYSPVWKSAEYILKRKIHTRDPFLASCKRSNPSPLSSSTEHQRYKEEKTGRLHRS